MDNNNSSGYSQQINDLKSMLPSVSSCTALKKESANSFCGPCPKCGGRDRFVYKTDSEKCWCRQCHEKPMDIIDFHCWIYGKKIKELFKDYQITFSQSSQEDFDQYKKSSLQEQWNGILNIKDKKPIKSLLIDKRRLTKDVVRKAWEADNIRFKNHAGKDSVAISYKTMQGDVRAIQCITIDGEPFPFTIETGKPANKVFIKGSESGKECFFICGTDFKKSKKVVIVESVVNAMTVAQCYPEACCIAIGGSTYIKKTTVLKPFKDGKKFVCAFDNDDAGKKAAQMISNLLGTCHSIQWGNEPSGHDVNDLLQAGQEKRVVELIKKAILLPMATPETKPIPLPDELLPVESFDYDLLPEKLQPWVQDICERVQCPPDFVAVGVMATLGSLIGRKVGIRPQAKTDWTVIPNQWAMIVGRPGLLKSPALEQALAPIKRLAAEAQDQYQDYEDLFEKEQLIAKLKKEAAEKNARKKLKENSKADLLTVLAVDEPDVPVLKRYIVNDTTPASLGELLRQNTNGLLVFRDEMVSLLKNLDKPGQEEGRGFYLTGWNGDSAYTFDRIGRGLNLYIPAVCISLLGGTQPGRLSEYVRHAVKGGAADDGLIQRYGLIVWPDTNGSWKNVDRWPDNEAKNRAFEVFKKIDLLEPLDIGAQQDTDFNNDPEGVPFLRFEPAALELFLEWRIKLETRLRGELHPALESHFAKYRKLIPALALIIHLADDGHGDVTERAVMQALAWGEYLESHAQRVYGSVSQPEIAIAKAILNRIKKGDLAHTFVSREVWRPGWAKLSDSRQVLEGLNLLEDYGWIESERVETKGRPKTEYHAHESIGK